MNLLELHDCEHCYDTVRINSTVPAFTSRVALRLDRLLIRHGEAIALLGPNGSGKSTLLEILGALLRPSSGSLLRNGQAVWEQGRQLAVRRECPILLQKSFLFSGSVLRNVMYGLAVRRVPRAEAKRRAQDAMRKTDVLRLADRRHHQLSGGERRRVALAAVLALQTDTILMDEPTAGLDFNSQCLVEELIRTINREEGVTVIFASHDLRQASDLATRRIALWQGRMLEGTLYNLLPGRIHVADRQTMFEHAYRELRIPLGCEPQDRSCDIAIDPDRIELFSPDSELMPMPEALLKGRVTSMAELTSHDQQQKRLKLTVVCGAVRLVVRMQQSRFEQLRLRVGDLTHVHIPDEAIQLLTND